MHGKARPSYFNFYPIGYRQITGRWDPSFATGGAHSRAILDTQAAHTTEEQGAHGPYKELQGHHHPWFSPIKRFANARINPSEKTAGLPLGPPTFKLKRLHCNLSWAPLFDLDFAIHIIKH